MFPFLLILLVIGATVAFRLLAGRMDHERVREYIVRRGGTILELQWRPFGPGWFGTKKNRIYEVRFIDREGNRHHAFCQTSSWSGVYFTEDTIEQHAAATAPPALEEENRRLREELERLKRRET